MEAVVCSHDEVQLRRSGVLMLIRGGQAVVIHTTPGLEESMLRLLLLGPAFALLLQQRGNLVLHAAAVAVRGAAVGLLGASGSGKSTLAAALHDRGHRLFADDYIALHQRASGSVVHPGFPQLKLWPDSAAALGHNPDRLPRLHPNAEKRTRRVTRRFARRPAPVGQLYVLTEGDCLQIERLSPRDALIELVRHTYAARLLQQLDASQHFLQCAAVARAVPVARLTYPRRLELLTEVAHLVETDASGHSRVTAPG
ncbi:MAG: hypothetical protein AUI36_34175 [Cyanobacteria bacterium 13_1_40CM_2_61_4]|nr:MAG: hypothetical protein AUI36_34175 [Cyanobacteria bacterium 13_1_40CM_2_61_4]